MLITFQKGTLHVLLHYVEDKNKVEDAKVPPNVNHLNVVEWMSFVEPPSDPPTCIASWQLDRVRRFAFQGSLDYIDLVGTSKAEQDSCLGFWCLTEKPFSLIYDSSGEIYIIQCGAL